MWNSPILMITDRRGMLMTGMCGLVTMWRQKRAGNSTGIECLTVYYSGLKCQVEILHVKWAQRENQRDLEEQQEFLDKSWSSRCFGQKKWKKKPTFTALMDSKELTQYYIYFPTASHLSSSVYFLIMKVSSKSFRISSKTYTQKQMTHESGCRAITKI